MQSPNYLNYLPYPTDYQMVLMEPEIPMPMYSLETNNNFLLGGAKLYLAPYVATFPHTSWEECVHETALRSAVVNAWDAPGAAAASSASSSATSAASAATSSNNH